MREVKYKTIYLSKAIEEYNKVDYIRIEHNTVYTSIGSRLWKVYTNDNCLNYFIAYYDFSKDRYYLSDYPYKQEYIYNSTMFCLKLDMYLKRKNVCDIDRVKIVEAFMQHVQDCIEANNDKAD